MAGKWGYGASDGPDTWGKTWPAANGKEQSPVDIVGAVKADLGPISFNFHTEDQVNVSNAGWTMIAGCSKGSELSGGPVSEKYKLVSFHFHWGPTDAAGSEHKVAGKQYPAELHIVYYNADKYGSFAEASSSKDGLLIIAVFCNVGGDLAGAKNVINGASSVTECGAKASVSGPFDPRCLLPGNTNNYWVYHGSLTCPPCTENVDWIVMQDTITVSSGQLATFRTINDFEGEPLVQNCRGCCPIGSRKIKSSF